MNRNELEIFLKSINLNCITAANWLRHIEGLPRVDINMGIIESNHPINLMRHYLAKIPSNIVEDNAIVVVDKGHILTIKIVENEVMLLGVTNWNRKLIGKKYDFSEIRYPIFRVKNCSKFDRRFVTW
jgi:hypothetical protein